MGKRKKIRIDFLSIFTTLLIIFVIAVTVLFSMDLLGIISLPEKFSLKTYFPNLASASNTDVYYPDYNATGTTVIEEEEKDDVEYTLQTSPVTSTSSTAETSNVTDNSYFYNQLDSYGKTIYSRLYSNIDELKTGTAIIDFGTTFNDLLQNENGDQALTDAFQLSINALLMDHPEIFYLDVTKIYMYTEATKTIAGTTYSVSIGPGSNSNYLAEGFSSESDVLVAEAQVQGMLQTISNRLAGNTYDKIKQVHNYLVDNTVYDSNSASELSHGIYGTLVNKLAVCDGYSKSFKYILDYLGISCVEVCGVAQNSNGETENHAWNYVLINGVWYAVDVTWDDPIIIGGGTLTDSLRYNHFLKGSNTFFATHTEDGYIVSNGCFSYPTLNSIDY